MFSPPGARLPLWLSTAHYLSRLHPWHRRLRAFLAEAPLLSASAKNRFGLRVDRLQPPLAPVLRDFPRKLRVHYGFRSLRPQTIFDGYTLAITDTSGCAYGVGPLPFRCQPETSACYSEPSMPCCRAPSSTHTCAILTAALLPPIEEEVANIPRPRHIPHRTSSATPSSYALVGQSGFIAYGQRQGLHCSPHPECGDCPLYTPPSVSRLRHRHRQPRASLFTAPLLSAVNKDRCGLRVNRLRPPATLQLSPTPLLRHGVGPLPLRLWLQTIFGDSASLRCQPETSACYSGLSTPCRRAPSFGRRKSAISTFLPPAEVAVLAVQSIGFLDYTPTPGPRCTVRRCTDSTPAVGQPLHSLRVCLRLRARAGRQTLKPQADFRDCLSLHCVARHLPFASILM